MPGEREPGYFFRDAFTTSREMSRTISFSMLVCLVWQSFLKSL